MKKLPFILLLALVIVYLCALGAAGPTVQAVFTEPPFEEPALCGISYGMPAQTQPAPELMAFHG